MRPPDLTVDEDPSRFAKRTERCLNPSDQTNHALISGRDPVAMCM